MSTIVLSWQAAGCDVHEQPKPFPIIAVYAESWTLLGDDQVPGPAGRRGMQPVDADT